MVIERFLLQDREKFSALLTLAEDWLYDEGEGQGKQVYVDKLAELKVSVWFECIITLRFPIILLLLLLLRGY